MFHVSTNKRELSIYQLHSIRNIDVKLFQYWIDNLKLVEHPGDEDGFFCEAFWDDSIKVDVNSPDGEKRCIASIAYFLQEQDEGGILTQHY